MGQDPNKCTGIFEVFLKTEAPFFLLPAWGGCAPKYYCIFGHGAPPLAHQCKKNVGRNISLQLVHAPKLMLFHICDAALIAQELDPAPWAITCARAYGV